MAVRKAGYILRHILLAFALAITAITLTGCTREKSSASSVTIQLPTGTQQKSYNMQSVSSLTSNWGVSDPTTMAEVVCYAVAVSGPEPNLQSRVCSDSSGTPVFRAGVIVGTFSSGTDITVTVPSGSARVIRVIGFAASSSSACRIFDSGDEPLQSELSAPHIIGQQTLDLEPGTVSVSINVSITGAQKFDDCTGFDMPAQAVSYSKAVAGGNSSCGVGTDGKLRCWGSNDAGQLGIGTTVSQSSPVIVDGSVNYQAVATGSNGGSAHTCAITSAGVLKCWGDNAWGAVGDGTSTNRTSPVVVDAGVSYSSVSVGGNGNQAHSCGITTTGVLKCWGANNYGQIGDATTTLRTTPVVIASGTTFTKVSVGDEYTCAIATGGLLKCWGRNSNYYQLGDGTATDQYSPVLVDSGTSYLYVSASSARTCGIISGGLLKCWGTGYLGTGASTFSNTPLVVDSGSTYTQVSLGSGSSCGVTSANVLKCWGANGFGDVGNGTNAAVNLPVAIDAGVSYQAVSVGSSHTCGISLPGILKCWGDNSAGQLGDKTTTSHITPMPVP